MDTTPSEAALMTTCTCSDCLAAADITLKLLQTAFPENDQSVEKVERAVNCLISAIAALIFRRAIDPSEEMDRTIDKLRDTLRAVNVINQPPAGHG